MADQIARKVPPMRFRGCDGVWEEVRLGAICTIGDADHWMPETTADGIPYVMTGDFCGINEIDFENAKRISETDYEKLSRKIKPEFGDILFARYASIGSVRRIVTTKRFVASYSCAILKRDDSFNSEYLFFMLQAGGIQNQVKHSINTGSQGNVGIESLKQLTCFFPVKSEQAKIAAYFRKINRLIGLYQRKHDKLMAIKKAMVQRIFPKPGTTTPEMRFRGFSEEWRSHRLGDIVQRVVRKNSDLESLRPLTISSKYGLIDQAEYFNKRVASKDVSSYFLIRNGEFAYNKSYSEGSPYGAVRRLDRHESGVLSTLYILFSPDPHKIESNFLVAFFATDLWHAQVASLSAEGARNHGLLNISAEDFLKIEVGLPCSLEEQEKIGAYFQNLDDLISLYATQIQKLDLTKSACLEKMFV